MVINIAYSKAVNIPVQISIYTLGLYGLMKFCWIVIRNRSLFWSINCSKKNPEKFRQYMRMLPSQFHYLVELLTPIIQKQDTNYRKAITPAQRLIVTIR